jgi:4-hydroxy-tetrahydrodipicolinate synthase
MFHGSLVAIVTPMQSDDTVDVESLRHLVEWHIEQGSDGIVVIGTTGEAPTLNPGEQRLVIQQALEQARGRVPIIAGTGCNSTERTVHLTRTAMELGVDACLIIAPYYNKPTQEGIYQHFKKVAETVPIPIILYNHPGRTGIDVQTATVSRLARLPNIIGLKEGTGSLQRLRDILQSCGTEIDVYSGEDATGMEFMLAGGKGVISVTANIAPKLMHKMCAAAINGDRERAVAYNRVLAELHVQLFVESNPIPVKWALHHMGLIPLGIRLPLTVLSTKYYAQLHNTLQQAGCLPLSKAESNV